MGGILPSVGAVSARLVSWLLPTSLLLLLACHAAALSSLAAGTLLYLDCITTVMLAVFPWPALALPCLPLLLAAVLAALTVLHHPLVRCTGLYTGVPGRGEHGQDSAEDRAPVQPGGLPLPQVSAVLFYSAMYISYSGGQAAQELSGQAPQSALKLFVKLCFYITNYS